jgi:hypothetical protein
MVNAMKTGSYVAAALEAGSRTFPYPKRPDNDSGKNDDLRKNLGGSKKAKPEKGKARSDAGGKGKPQPAKPPHVKSKAKAKASSKAKARAKGR